MPRYKVILECTGPAGTDVHCYTTEGKTDWEAVSTAVGKCRVHYPEYDAIIPRRTEYVGR